jgi:small conductance mechanosensitive channel
VLRLRWPSGFVGALAAGAAPAAASLAQAPAAGQAIGERARERARSLGEVGSDFLDRLIDHLPNLAAALAIFALFWLFARLSARVLKRLFARTHTDPALAQVAVPLARLSLLGLGALAAIEQVGFNVGSLLAGVGIAGLAIGLAAQETLANLLAGIALLWDRPFRLGDSVTVAGTFGVVTEIGLRSTRLRTLEQLEVTLPNKEVAQRQIVNHSRYPETRLHVPLRVGHGEPIARVREVLLEAIAAEAHVLAQPAPQVVVTALDVTGVALELRVWLKNPAPPSATLFHFLELAKSRFDAAGIALPSTLPPVLPVEPPPAGAEPAASA